MLPTMTRSGGGWTPSELVSRCEETNTPDLGGNKAANGRSLDGGNTDLDDRG